MNVQRIDCPYCGANIETDTDTKKIMYCQYCGNKLRIENDSNDITVNQNININKSINQRVTNDAEILKEQNRHRENRWKLIIVCVLFVFVISSVVILAFNREKNSTEKTVSTELDYNDENIEDNTVSNEDNDILPDSTRTETVNNEVTSKKESNDAVSTDEPLYIDDESGLPAQLYNGDLGTYYLNSIIHYSNKEDSPIYTEGYFFEMEFENGTDVNAYCLLGNAYLNDYRILVYTPFAEKVVVAPGKKGIVTSNIRDENITDKMKGFKQIDCTFYIEDENENKIFSKELIIDESLVVYQ